MSKIPVVLWPSPLPTLWKRIATVMLFGLVMLLSTAPIAALIAPSTAAAPGRLVIELSKVGVIVSVAWAGPLSASEATPASSSDANPAPARLARSRTDRTPRS
jgi:hypothetical protein